MLDQINGGSNLYFFLHLRPFSVMRTPSIYSQDDPLTEALRPPESETEFQRRNRLEQEAEAKRVSEQIDEELRLERENLKRKRGDVKVLLFFSLIS